MRVRSGPILSDKEKLPRTATPDWDLCNPHPTQSPALLLSPSHPQHLADRLLQAALEGPGETARGRMGTMGSHPPLLGKWIPHL